jgi:hypothetical protein
MKKLAISIGPPQPHQPELGIPDQQGSADGRR